MNINNSDAINFLDEVRTENGIDSMKNYFIKLIGDDRQKAINLLNDDTLRYGTLFLLKDIIKDSNLTSNLNNRNKFALQITNEILENNSNIYFEENMPTKYISCSKFTLRWILSTGYKDDGLSNDFDRIIDVTAGLLTKIYKDMTSLPIIVDLIFKRHQKGTLIHDLVWALFESQDPACLMLIANRLQSNETKEIELVHKLLSFIPGINTNNNGNKKEQYLSFLRWFEENYLFLRYTGESLQQTGYPIPFVVDLESKYLCRAIKLTDKLNNQALSQSEISLLNRFRKLNYDTKVVLASFSYKTRQSNMRRWREWINYPIKEQVKIARRRMGWYYD